MLFQSSCINLLVISVLFLSPVSSERVTTNHCGLACGSVAEQGIYADCDTTSSVYGACYCTSDLFAEITALCIRQNCQSINGAQVYDQVAITTCEEAGLERFSLGFEAALTKVGSGDLPSYDSINFTEAVTKPFTISGEDWENWYRTIDVFYTQLDLGTIHGCILLAFLAGIVAIAMIQNVIVHLMQRFPALRSSFMTRPRLVTRLVQRYLVHPSLFAGKHLVRPRIFGIALSLPTRIESFIVAIYTLLALGLVCSRYRGTTFDANFYWPDAQPAQLSRYIADRAGVMAFTQLPLIFLFAGRNNVLIYLTGWSFQTFNVYHKWVSRVMWSLAVVHSVAYTVNAVQEDYLVLDYADTYWKWGVVAIILSSAILLQAAYNFRTLAYDIFVIVHVVLVALFVVACWWHCNTLGWMQYLYASIAVWAFDRVIRLARVLYFSCGLSHTAMAHISVAGGGTPKEQILLLRISAAHALTSRPGQYVYLHFGGVAPWQSHPFTLAGLDPVTGSHILAVRVHDGLTYKLYQRVVAHVRDKDSRLEIEDAAHPTIQLRIGIDGPYGRAAQVDLYDTALLIAGGIGITGVLSYVQFLLSQKEHHHTTHVELVWITRYRDLLEVFQSQLVQLQDLAAQGSTSLTIRLFVTREAQNSQEVVEWADTKQMLVDKTRPTSRTTSMPLSNLSSEGLETTCNPSRIKLRPRQGRPEMSQVVGETVTQATGSVAVLTCGPSALADEARAAVCSNIEHAKGRLDYFEGVFGW